MKEQRSPLKAEYMESQSRSDDATLVKSSLKGNKEAFILLIERYTPQLWAYIKRKVYDRTTIEDLIQETWLRAHESLHNCTRPEGFGPWLYVIARNSLLKWLEKNKVRTTIPLDENRIGTESVDENFEKATQKAKSLNILDSAIASLEEPYREVIRLKYKDGLTCNLISLKLKKPVGTVKRHLAEAYAKLRIYMNSKEVSHE